MEGVLEEAVGVEFDMFDSEVIVEELLESIGVIVCESVERKLLVAEAGIASVAELVCFEESAEQGGLEVCSDTTDFVER